MHLDFVSLTIFEDFFILGAEKEVIITCSAIFDILAISTCISTSFFYGRFKISGGKFLDILLEKWNLCPLHLNLGRLCDCSEQ